MTEEQLKAFLSKAQADHTLQNKLNAAKTPDEVVTLAKDYGYGLDADNLNLLREEDLEVVSGGTYCVVWDPNG